MIAGEQTGSGKGMAKNASPQLQQILPLLLTFLDSRSWCSCLAASPAAHDAVRVLFSGLMTDDGQRPEEGWTGAIRLCFIGDRVYLNRLFWALRFRLFVDAHEHAWFCISSITS